MASIAKRSLLTLIIPRQATCTTPETGTSRFKTPLQGPLRTRTTGSTELPPRRRQVALSVILMMQPGVLPRLIYQGRAKSHTSSTTRIALVRLTQGTRSVSFDYDTADRRTSLVLPNGVTLTYGYDSASRLSSINYKARPQSAWEHHLSIQCRRTVDNQGRN